jgi:hypothetical protein
MIPVDYPVFSGREVPIEPDYANFKTMSKLRYGSALLGGWVVDPEDSFVEDDEESVMCGFKEDRASLFARRDDTLELLIDGPNTGVGADDIRAKG